MATWIVHLRLAERLLSTIDGLDAGWFATGNIAPDSGIPDEKWENFNPPVEITHFRSGAGGQRCAHMDFYRRYLAPVKAEDDPERFSFLLGYFFHLATDNLWYRQVGIPTKERFAAQFAADKNFIWEVKRDWYGLDFETVRGNPESIFWRVFLDCEYTQDYLDFLPPEAIQRNMAHIKDFYRRSDEEIEEHYIRRPGIYLTAEEMDRFVSAGAERLRRVYRFLWEEKIDPPPDGSALLDFD